MLNVELKAIKITATNKQVQTSMNPWWCGYIESCDKSSPAFKGLRIGSLVEEIKATANVKITKPKKAGVITTSGFTIPAGIPSCPYISRTDDKAGFIFVFP